MSWPPPHDPPSGGIEVGGARYPVGPPEQWPAHLPQAPGAASWGALPPPPPEGAKGSSPLVLALVGIVVVLVLLGVGIAALSGGDSDDVATDTTVDLSDPEITAPPSEEPVDPPGLTMPSFPGLGPGSGVDPQELARPLDEVLPELIAFVEQTRGHEFTTDPVVLAVDEDEFVAKLQEASAGEAEALERRTVTDAALGLIPPDADLGEVSEAVGAAGVLGFYDPETGELYVKGESITPYVQQVIVHELTHALDDQIFDLGRLEALAERGDESAFGFLALVEGTANHVMDAWVGTLTPDEEAALALEQLDLSFDQMTGLFDIPPTFLVESQIPYASGQRFVDDLVAEGGMAAVDAAYDDPPTTSEQILDADVFRAGEPSVPLQPVAADGAVAEEGAFGAVDLRLLELAADPTGALLGPELGAIEPLDGFGGGTFASWTDGGERCVRFEVVGDDDAGSAAVLDIVESWADTVGDAQVATRPGGTGVDVVTAERCL